MLFDVSGWEVGKVKDYNPKLKTQNYNITWEEGVRGSMLTLDDYYDYDDPNVREASEIVECNVGQWLYLKKEE